ncbi:MAG TPA: PepSY domain-containing protein [Acetobacteraceae bacterium]|nr:PepSY domain-containing protein [Acetobacteraceae bacterium]
MRPTATLAFALALAGGATTAFADMPGPDWMPFEQVVQKLKEAGYTQIAELQADDGHWEGEGMKNGRKMEFHADPRTGVITSEHPD